MKKRASRSRCSECREWFIPDNRCDKRQRVCGEGCRQGRRARLARRRRSLDPVRYREEERERKRRSRRSGPAPVLDDQGVVDSACHAPASARKPLTSRKKIRDFWDKEMGVSRARLEREVLDIVSEFAQKLGQEGAPERGCHAPP